MSLLKREGELKRIPVIVLGAGGVGSALLRQIMGSRQRVQQRNEVVFEVIAVADSRSCWCQTAGHGLGNGELMDIVNAKKEGLPVDPAARSHPHQATRPTLPELLMELKTAGVENAIVVDATATDGLEPGLQQALDMGYGVVLANKKPLAGPWKTASPFYNHPRLRHESTVGGGQPVIATLRYLLDVNDPIYQIEGQLSGTLGFICGRLDEGVLLSQAIREAKECGYTEPDPREDLGGQDVMRKVMILGRMAGWPLEAEDITVESLYTPDLASLSVPAFMEAAVSLDRAMQERVMTARTQGYVLRYVAVLGQDGGTVGLNAIPASSPLANMKYISFRTGRYHDEPLLIGGKGAGVEMTAAGVLGDMISLARECY